MPERHRHRAAVELHTLTGSSMMKKLAIAFAVGTACADGRFRRQRRRQFGKGKDLD